MGGGGSGMILDNSMTRNMTGGPRKEGTPNFHFTSLTSDQTVQLLVVLEPKLVALKL
jgi:hypothetical protein